VGPKNMSAPKEHAFQAEVSQVLHLVVNSLYSNKEIFLRELVSNASDALDKLRFRAVSDKELISGDEGLKIVIEPDEAAGTLTIRDNGIGMTEQELIDQLGTIARSGTKEFTEKLKEAAAAKDSGTQLIGQFGVGFYSAFLVADRVEVISKAAGQTAAFRWESQAKDSFTVEPAERESRGTTIVLHLKEDQKDYAKPYRIKDVIRRHSDYVAHPIELLTKSAKGDKEGEAETEEKSEVINQANALWQRSPKDVTKEQYAEFYKHLAHDWEDPLAYKHFKVEGTQMFAGIVFIPETVRADLLDPRGEHGVRLHVRRVLAMESCDDLLPKWLRFVRGVIDSEDLPLNVSRETLQDSRIVKVMRKQVVSQVLSMIEELEGEKPADFLKFWENFGAILKEGLHFEPEYKDRLANIVRYHSTYEPSDEKEKEETRGWTSLAQYKSRMKDGQPGIYYLEGSSQAVLSRSPHLEQLKKRGFEVLLMTDGVDPFALEQLRDFDGHRMINAMKEELDLGDEKQPEETELNSELTKRFKEVLGEKVGDVRASKRLAESPACLVTPEGGLPPHMEAMFRAQNLSIPLTKRIFEFNPDHPVVENLRRLLLVQADSPKISDWMELIYDQALIAEGSQVADPTLLAKRLTDLLTTASQDAVAHASK
jgi:molecular chaperone HtpG